MIGFAEHVVSATVAGVASVIGAAIAGGAVYFSRQAQNGTSETRAALDTGNGHTIGQAVARIEDAAWRHETRLDSLEIELREMRAEMAEHHPPTQEG